MVRLTLNIRAASWSLELDTESNATDPVIPARLRRKFRPVATEFRQAWDVVPAWHPETLPVQLMVAARLGTHTLLYSVRTVLARSCWYTPFSRFTRESAGFTLIERQPTRLREMRRSIWLYV